MSQLTTADFASGKYKIAQDNFSTASLQSYIDKFEKVYLQSLLGVDLYDLYIAAVDGNGGVNPPAGIYLDIHQPFAADNRNPICSSDEIAAYYHGSIVRSEGILEMLKGFIYFEFVRDQPVKNTISGEVENNVEQGKVLNSVQSGLREKFNAAVMTHIAIQWKIGQSSSSYPLFNGQEADIITY